MQIQKEKLKRPLFPTGTKQLIFGEKDPKGDGYQVVRDLYGNDLTEIRTDSEGRYQFGGPVGGDNWEEYGLERALDYYVIFEYDGINYEAVERDQGTELTDSDVTEIDRAGFNNKFKTISSGASSNIAALRSYGKAGAIGLTYRDVKIDEENYRSYLITTAKAGEEEYSPGKKTNTTLQTRDIARDYQMHATTIGGANANDAILTSADRQAWQSTWDPETKYMAIDMGLRERLFMLGLSKDVYEAKATINGKETTYTYNELMEADKGVLYGKLYEAGQVFEKAKNNNTHELLEYNMWLQKSDYNFRVSDYDGIINNPMNTENNSGAFKGQSEALRVFVTYSIILTNYTMEGGIQVDKIVDYYDQNYQFNKDGYYYKDELGNPVHIDSIVYANYTGYKNIQEYTCSGCGGKHKVKGIDAPYTDPNVIKDETKNYTIDTKYGKKENYKKMTLELGQPMYSGATHMLLLTFEVTPNLAVTAGSGAIGEIPLDYEYSNFADIIEYTTPKGFVDKNSAPGTLIADNNKVHFERHSDSAPGFIIKILEEVRQISGKVWEDGKPGNQGTESYYHGDGEYEDNPIDNVIVQLVEIKDLDKVPGRSSKYEYVWQETLTGSGKVKSLNNQGNSTYDYETEKVPGVYIFEGYIPGDYIIRFIYGDGKTYDLYSDDSVKQYNGQDYQSTVDLKYNQPDFKYEVHKTGGQMSDARDNEARRLEVMAYSALMDEEVGRGLRDASIKGIDTPEGRNALDNTWMCAETSQILISFEENAAYNDSYNSKNVGNQMDNMYNMLNKPKEGAFIDANYYKEFNEYTGEGDIIDGFYIYGERKYRMHEGTAGSSWAIEEKYVHILPYIDFGLQLRPRTLLELEKHLVGLHIDAGGITILDARAKNKEDVKGGQSKFYSTNGMSDLMLLGWHEAGARGGLATREVRGQWYFQTDMEELGRGSNLEATYQYIVRNYSEIDYLNKNLIQKYRDNYKYQTGAESIDVYIDHLIEIAALAKANIKDGIYYNNKTNAVNGYNERIQIGEYLGSTYYTGVVAGDVAEVPTRAEEIVEAVNNLLTFSAASGTETGVHFEVKETDKMKPVYKRQNGPQVLTTELINTVVKTRTPTDNLLRYTGIPDGSDRGEDIKKELVLTAALSNLGKDDELQFDSYIAEIFTYSNAAGRRDAGIVGNGAIGTSGLIGRQDGSKHTPPGAVPGNLSKGNWTDRWIASDWTKQTIGGDGGASYVHAYDPEVGLSGYLSAVGTLEHDEFWGESIKITKPTGVSREIAAENNMNMTVFIAIPALVILGGGIVLIRRFVFIGK